MFLGAVSILAASAVRLTAAENAAVPPPVIMFDRAALTLNVGETNRLSARVRDSANLVLWESSNPGFATVSQDGLITALHEGSVTITAKLPDDPAVAECAVTVVARTPEAKTAAPEPPREITGIIIGNEIPEMVVGDDLGIIATCLPYKVFESNPYTLETSDSNILQVSRANIVTAVGPGKVTLTARTPNGHTDSITFEVRPRPLDEVPPEAATCQVEPGKFGIVLGTVTPEQARQNSMGVNAALLYAQRWGYRTIVFPNGVYMLDPAESISMRSNLRVDLNGSTWQIIPNTYSHYALIRFKELNGPNLFKNYDIRSETVTQKTLSASPVSKVLMREEDTSILSLPIPVGAVADRQAPDQATRALMKESPCFVSTPIAIDKTVTTPGQPSGIEVRLKLNYYSNATLVAARDLGAIPLKETTPKRWCDRGNLSSFRLRSENDYTHVRLELRFAIKNCEVEVFTDRAVVCNEITAVLENSKLCNGTILGERDLKASVYPRWMNDPSTEGAVSIAFEEGRHNGIENLTVRKSIGFNMASSMGQRSDGAIGVGPIPLKFTDLEWGGLDEHGEPQESSTLQRTKVFLNVSALKDSFELGLPLGYMGYNLLRARVYDICFYDADKRLVAREPGRLAYRKYRQPPHAAWAKIVLHWDAAITAGHPDFSNAIGFVTEFKPPTANFIRNCVIEDNYSCGFAACGGINWRIEGNTFRRNGGRAPGCDIDWEDGWEYSQDDVVRSNVFESPHGLIVCAGVNHVFKNNVHKGKLVVYGRAQAMKFEGNTFGEEGKAIPTLFGSQTDTYICGNRFLGGPVRFTKEHGEKARYEAIWVNNVPTNTTLTSP